MLFITNTNRDIKLKTRATYLNSLAIASVLGISIQEENVDVYTTYENEKFYSLEGTTAPLAKPMLGEKKYDSKKEEWEKNRIFVNLGDKVQFRHYAV